MTETPVQFDDAAAYERMMGQWTQSIGRVFVDWLAVPKGKRWLDIGCGSGAFTEVIVQHCAPSEVQGVDPSPAQIDFAKERPGAKGAAQFQPGNAMALPFPEARFDATTMALVLFFVPEPQKGLAEMRRVLSPGGVAAAYVWDIPGGGIPHETIRAALRNVGANPPHPPSAWVSETSALVKLWTEAGFQGIETRLIDVERRFTDFDDYWTTMSRSATLKPPLAKLTPAELETVKTEVRGKLAADASGSILCRARVIAVKGRVAG